MSKLSILILVFTVAFAVFFLGPPLLNIPFGPYPLMQVADVFDIFTPLVLLPIYWYLYRLGHSEPPPLSGIIVFFVLAAFWAEGQGMHLGANSIGHLVTEAEGGNIYKLTYFYDEVLGHYLWHLGGVGLSAVIIYREWQNTLAGERVLLWPLICAGVIHGFTLFLIVIEGGTAPLGVTFALLVVLFGIFRGRSRFGRQPLFTFFFISYAVAMLFFIGWGIYWQGLPEFSEVMGA